MIELPGRRLHGGAFNLVRLRLAALVGAWLALDVVFLYHHYAIQVIHHSGKPILFFSLSSLQGCPNGRMRREEGMPLVILGVEIASRIASSDCWERAISGIIRQITQVCRDRVAQG